MGKKVDFFGGGLALEDGVAVRKASEADNNIAMPVGKVQGISEELFVGRGCGVRKCLVPGDTRVLVGKLLTMLERQIEEDTLDVTKFAIEATCETSDSERTGMGITGKGIGAVSVNDARELVEDDDEGKAGPGRVRPGIELSGRRRGQRVGESVGDLRVLLWRFAPPQRRFGAIDGKIIGFVAEPEL